MYDYHIAASIKTLAPFERVMNGDMSECNVHDLPGAATAAG